MLHGSPAVTPQMEFENSLLVRVKEKVEHSAFVLRNQLDGRLKRRRGTREPSG